MEGDEDEVDAAQMSQFASQCLLSFKVENNTNLSKVIELKIIPEKDENGLQVPLNFKCPVSTIPCQVFSNQSTAVIHLTKLDPNFDDWGAFTWSFTIQDKQKNQYQNAAAGNNNQGYSNNWNTNGNNGDLELSGTGYADADIPTEQGKACPSCTYLNPVTYTICEIC